MARYDFLNEINETPIFQYYEKHGEKKAGAAALSTLRMKSGLASKMAKASIKVGAHIKGGKASVRTGVQKRNGHLSIKQLLQWQKDNNFRVCDLERTNEWKAAISKSHKGKVLSEEIKNKVRDSIHRLNQSMSKDERSKMYSNNARATAATKRKIEILNSIKSNEFTSTILKEQCKKFDYDYKLMIKDRILLERIYTGTNQSNPSIYKKI
jgi:hypothetical protein